MSCTTSSYNLGVRNVLLGKDTKQKFCITTKADVALSLQNDYFVVHEPVSQDKHYFWFNVATAGVDPAVPNATGHAIAIASGASATAVATATQTVLAGLAWIDSAVQDGKHIEVTLDVYGYAYEARDALASANKTGFVITVSQFGSTQVDLGATSGDITMSVEEVTKEIKAPQTGDYVLGEIRRGATAGLSFELKDSSSTSIRRCLNFYGSTIVTDDAASETITGYGSKNLFKSTEDVATQMILRPTELADEADASQDLTLPKAKLKLGETTFSAENELVLPIDVIAYLDLTKNSFVNFLAYGDASKIPAV